MSAPQLRVHFADEPDERSLEIDTLIKSEPRLAWRLREFCDNWAIPKVFSPRQRSAKTIESYGHSLRYWEEATSDPMLAEVVLDRDDQLSIDFVGDLPELGYSRRGMRRGEPIRVGRMSSCPAFTPLSSMSARTHATRIATLLTMAGPRYSPRQRVAELLPRLPYVPPVEADFEPKPPYSLAAARQIAAAAGQLSRPQLPDWVGCELWWKVRLALFYYTGLRAGTVVSLCWSHVEERSGALWLKIPKALIKTRKAIELPCHGQLAELLQQLRSQLPPGLPPGELLLPPGCGYRHFVTLHSDLQEAAGIAKDDRQSPHAWRRTHLSQIGELGAFRGLEVSRVAADHADGRTTEQHYVTQLVNQLRLRLPPLF